MTDKLSNNHSSQAESNDKKTWPALMIDYSLYDEILADSGASDEEKREFLDVVWNIVVSFVDLGFGVHPLQQACEQKRDLSTLKFADVVKMNQTEIKGKFNQVKGEGSNV